MQRRNFLKLAGASTTVVFVSGCSGGLPVIPDRPDARLEDAASWISFDGESYTLCVPRAELGQNVTTAMKQIACTELDVAWEQVAVKRPDTGAMPAYRATVGSESIQDFAVPLAQACATLKEAVARGDSGVFTAEAKPADSLKSLQKGALREAPELVDADAILFGKPAFAGDITAPDMLFGRVLRSGLSPELASEPGAVDDRAARQVPGFVALVTSPDLAMNNSQGIGIVAATPGALDRIEAALEISWHNAASDQVLADAVDVDRLAKAGSPAYEAVNQKAPAGQARPEVWDIDLKIVTPAAAHAPIETHTAVAAFDKGQCRISVSSQDPFFVRDFLAKRLGMDKDDIIVQPHRVGGGFGGKVIPMAEVEAAVLAKAVGKPVKVQWTRAQSFKLAYHRPPTSHRIKAALQDGRIAAWEHRMGSGHVIFSNAILPKWMQSLTDFIGDKGAVRNLAPIYDFAGKQAGYDLTRLDIRTSAWRGLGAGPNALAIELAMDAAARQAGEDPIAFRLKHLQDARLANVLQTAAAAAPPPAGKVRGVACGAYKGVSYGAVIAEADYDSDGRPRITRVWCAHDCGKVINPDQVKAQCEGNLLWSLGMVMYDRLAVENGEVLSADFVDAPIPTMADMPQIETVLVDSDERPVGAGETLMASAPAAIANAVIALTGSLPDDYPVQLTRQA